MIKYKEIIYNKQHKYYQPIYDMLIKYPVKYINSIEEIHWTIPIFKNNKIDWVHHREDGPAIERGFDGNSYYWYGNLAPGKFTWETLDWRRKVELKTFFI